ncbi:hypothetical protein D9619_009087 [Psilocybe cf. subviscida]|uniref:Stress response protein NST1 n=1 Tax=Psilocybe cf. subviscida TaxID=2480587 RepID=A0A8H5FAI1_9AGAR|nr:hypothetical protein D9619_009087 [Psilocybe cf. subviscida]
MLPSSFIERAPVPYPPAVPLQPLYPSPATFPSSGLTVAQKGKGNANKIWSTSMTEERERIKDFWLGLGDQERRNLVKIEKDTVLKKMKEQQKHSCSCFVCVRKRNAIEEELEVLYDAYYEELDQYANYQQRYVSSGGTIPPPPGPGPFPGSVELDKDGADDRIAPNAQPIPPSRGGAVRAPADGRRNVAGQGRDGLFNIGSSLTVTGPGNILTVADDLLENDGQKFLEMMEQLAERRMQREEDAAANVEDESEEESERGGSDINGDDGDDVGSEEEDEEDEEDDEEEMMTEEQKIEEGKRMFSIFAARMFEQRVLQAYRQKEGTYMQILRELHEEDDEYIPHPQPTRQNSMQLPAELEEKSTQDREMKNLGRWEFWINLWAVCRVVFSTVLVASSIMLVVFSVMLFSVMAVTPLTKVTMNYSSVVFTAIGIIPVIWYMTRGKYIYHGAPNPPEEGEERETSSAVARR